MFLCHKVIALPSPLSYFRRNAAVPSFVRKTGIAPIPIPIGFAMNHPFLRSKLRAQSKYVQTQSKYVHIQSEFVQT